MSSSWTPGRVYVPRHARRQLLAWAFHASMAVAALAALAVALGR